MSELRNTRQRTAVMDALNASNRFQSAQELHASLADAGTRVGLTTVYRTLGALAVAGDIDTVVSADGQVLYRRCDVERHHHHLVCRVCRRTVEVDGPAVEAWADQVADEHGFVDVSHTVEVFGRCRSCAAKPSGTQPSGDVAGSDPSPPACPTGSTDRADSTDSADQSPSTGTPSN